MIVSTPIRWYRLTPDRLVMVLAGHGMAAVALGTTPDCGFNRHRVRPCSSPWRCVGVAMLFMLRGSSSALIFRWRFQFSIRSLMLLVVIVAIPV